MPQSLMHFFARSPLRAHLAVAAVFAVLLAVELFGAHRLATTEARLADIYMRRHAPELQPDPDIVVVDIDDPSMVAMQDIAGLWAWPREIHADLIEGLMAFSPRAFVLDLSFSDRDAKRPKSDARLAEAIKAAGNVYLSAVRLDAGLDTSGTRLAELSGVFGLARAGTPDGMAALLLPHVADRADWRLGLVNSVKDDDGVQRRYRLQTDVHGWLLPSLPARLMRDLKVALPAGDDILLRWTGSGHRHFSYGELYRLVTEKHFNLNADELRTLDALFRNKIIVIGSSAAGAFDHHVTPLGAATPGVDILATAIDNLKNRQYVRVAPGVVSMTIGVALLAALAWAFARRHNPLMIGVTLLLVSAALIAGADAALAHNLLLPLATPLAFAWSWYLAAAIGGYLRERRTREQAVSLFGRFLNPNVVRQIVDQGETVESLSGRTSDISVLFSDIRGFTTLSETRSPQDVVKLLNRYFDRQVDVVFRHGGTLDKFIGDCIMAFWGAPVADPRHAERAVSAALEMQQVLLDFKRELEAEEADVPEFDVGIGVHTGTAVVGFIGAQKKLDYTAIGDTVNLASRVEGLTKGIARVLVTRDTMQACQPSAALEFKPHGAFAVKGRAAAVELYEPMRKT